MAGFQQAPKGLIGACGVQYRDCRVQGFFGFAKALWHELSCGSRSHVPATESSCLRDTVS